MSIFVLPLSDSNATLETVGGKGMSLAKMARAGLPVPDGFHVTTEAYQSFITQNGIQPHIDEILKGPVTTDLTYLETISQQIGHFFTDGIVPPEIASVVISAYAGLHDRAMERAGIPTDASPITAVAVRSSATAEDLPGASFAGQHETYLNICGAEAVLEAVKKCWASLWTARAITYRAQQGIAPEGVTLAVVIQEMVFADAAGILFTANPVSGKRNEVVITAAWGLGEAIVGGSVTPDTLLVEKTTGKLIHRATSDKQVMTVQTKEGTREEAVPDHLRKRTVLTTAQAVELAKLGEEIEKLYKIPMDIEWTLVNGKFAIVQARPITILPEPEPPEPVLWKLPAGQYSAMRNNIVELMPNPLTPLFDTLGRASINASLGRQLIHFLGRSDIMPDEMIITVNGYAYNNGSVRPLKALAIILDTAGILNRMFTGAVERWTVAGRPAYIMAIEKLKASPLSQLSSTALVNAACELFEAAIDAYGALISGVIPAAWMTEAIFTKYYNTFIKRRGDPSAQTFLLGFDSFPIQAEKMLYDLSDWVRAHPGLCAYLSTAPADHLAAQLRNDHTPMEVDPMDWHEWQDRIKTYLLRYGHTIYDLDFSNPLPAEDPTPLLATCQLFIIGHGINPHTRQMGATERREQAQEIILNRIKGQRLKYFSRFLSMAQRFAPLREDGLADIGLGYPLLRQMLRELGARFTANGLITNPDEIYWLTKDEAAQASAQLDRGEALASLSQAIAQRKAAWRAAKRVAPPMMLPQMKLLGFDLSALKSRRARKQKGNLIKGVAASPGQITGTACILHGPEDFPNMKTGDVLVAAITTPAWTPLFARASAVVTDVGGPLSHGSIVAREYGIPAVLGTGIATQRIHSGQKITVDGGRGTVLLHNE